jgi:hypothetical protein
MDDKAVVGGSEFVIPPVKVAVGAILKRQRVSADLRVSKLDASVPVCTV